MDLGSFIRVAARNFDVLAGPFVTLVYPLYASIKAIETKSPVDDQQWLTYWVLYSLIALFELTFAKVTEWHRHYYVRQGYLLVDSFQRRVAYKVPPRLPFWPYVKLIFSCWLVLPYFSGAAYVYQHFVRPMFVNQHTVNIWYFPQKKDVFRRPDDILAAAEKYIEDNGPEAFEELISKAERVAKCRNSSSTIDAEAESRSKHRNSGSAILDDMEADRRSTHWDTRSTMLDDPEGQELKVLEQQLPNI